MPKQDIHYDEIMAEKLRATYGKKRQKKKPEKLSVFRLFGVPGAIRTRGVPLRRRTLYPTEVRRLINFYALLPNHTLHS